MSRKLNAQQSLAVTSDASKIVCLAGAGTGKTFTLIERITRLADESGDPTSILALTFTNAAAFEMRSRYRTRNPNSITPEFRTFHSFCYALLCDDIQIRNELGFSDIPQIANESAVKRIETKVKLQLNLKLSQDKLDRKIKLTPKEEFLYETYIKAKRRLLNKENLISFDELSSRICDLFVNNSPLVDKYKSKYKYIFVDEFQDTDSEQWRFVSSFTDSCIFVCGDALQAIYGFRGADSSIIKDLADSGDWTTIKLYQNYRSTSEICSAANTMSTYADDVYRIEINSPRSGPAVKYGASNPIPYQTLVDKDVLVDIGKRLNNLTGTSAILCRTNKEVEEITHQLDRWNIPYDTTRHDDDPENLILCTLDNQFMVDWLSSFLNAEKYAEFIRACTIQSDKSPISVLLNGYGGMRQINYRAITVNEIRKIIKNSNLTINQKAKEILRVVGNKDLDITLDPMPENGKELLLQCLDFIKHDAESLLYVGTVHSVKGLEYDNVFVVGPGGYSWKLINEENLNLYYVAITRAKNYLAIYRGEWV